MCNLYRDGKGDVWKPGQKVPVMFADGTESEGVWAGSAREEKLDWWLGKAGNVLAQSELVTEVAFKADDDGELQWGQAPEGAHLLFVVEAPPPGKKYRLARMITARANPGQVAYFRHDRFSLFGTLASDGTIERIQPPPAPVPKPPKQRELF